MSDPRVRWPADLRPEASPVFAHDELAAEVTPAQLWACLIDAPRWHEHYPHCTGLVIHGGGDRLAPGTRFSWSTLGVRVTTVVDGFEPERYLSWSGRGLGARGHHVWLIEPTPRGCHIVTEETQAGVAARILAPVLRRALHHHHPRWLAGLARAAAAKGPLA